MMIDVFRWPLGIFLWTFLLNFIFTTAEGVKDASPVSVLHREKRDFQWKTIIVYEEKNPQNPPEKIGQLKNTRSSTRTSFKLFGEGANDIFSVNTNGDLFVKKRLDREKKSSYKLTAQLLDGNSEIETDEFIIEVQDINDHTPRFSDSPTGSIDERTKKGDYVLTVKADDDDDPSTPNGRIAYKLLNGTSFFTIDENTGVISTAGGALDREIQSQYKLIVQASDLPGSDGGRSSTTEVLIKINDINDNVATFSKRIFRFSVKEDQKPGFKIGTLHIEDRDEKENKKPRFTVTPPFNQIFDVELNDNNDGVLTLIKGLDYETTASYTLTITVTEDVVVQRPDNEKSGLALQLTPSAQIFITVEDVDEPPVFNQSEYTFNVLEGQTRYKVIGSVSARDADKTSHRIRYSIEDPKSPVEVSSDTGQLTLKIDLDREHQPSHTVQVTAQEESETGQKSYATVKINVLDINDNKPELANEGNVYLCENDEKGTVIGTIGATDADENPGKFRFALARKSLNFSLHDNFDNTANVILTHGHFSMDSSAETILEIEITDGGTPPQRSVTPLRLRVCACGHDRQFHSCREYYKSGISMSAIVAILFCIVAILVIVILFVLHKHYRRAALVNLGKPSSEIHEQLVSYDEEGGGEMDTDGYDVSVLSSAHRDGRLGPDPALPPTYAVVNKPQACKGDMAVMIEVKKDEADHDRDGIPYDTLHIYGYEGTESLAGSLSSLDSTSSFGSELDYDFLSDWGPRFRTLAELYGCDADTSY
ncbi:cadherin-5 [Trichomycterus rosablanca]|uniref:cadherin-5 n=1 Tax=Trichomycterus rosablanca TaxID=2290929 RepID=UPI002F34F96D